MMCLRPVSPEELLIDVSDSRPLWARILEAAATIVMWWIWLYLMVPFFGMLVLWVNVPWVQGTWIDVRQSQDLATFLGFCGSVFAGIILAVLGWGWANYLAFLRRGKAAPRPVVEAEDVANSLGVDPETLQVWRNAKTLVVAHDEHGGIHCMIPIPSSPEDWDTVL